MLLEPNSSVSSAPQLSDRQINKLLFTCLLRGLPARCHFEFLPPSPVDRTDLTFKQLLGVFVPAAGRVMHAWPLQEGESSARLWAWIVHDIYEWKKINARLHCLLCARPLISLSTKRSRTGDEQDIMGLLSDCFMTVLWEQRLIAGKSLMGTKKTTTVTLDVVLFLINCKVRKNDTSNAVCKHPNNFNIIYGT